MVFETIKWDDENNVAKIIDQTELPVKKVIKDISDVDGMWEAIKMLRVRGAPLIGVSAGYGVALAVKEANEKFELKEEDYEDFSFILEQYFDYIFKKIEYLSTSRPTAINLFWALDRMKKAVNSIKESNILSKNKCVSIRDFEIIKSITFKKILQEAKDIHKEDADMCEQIGIHGETLIKSGDSILTHCNAGSLATSAWGTALAPIYKAFDGWDSTEGLKEFDQLPENAKKYLKFLEEFVGVKIALVSTSPNRSDTIVL
jgi:methylthioribose-1-phosphate isomerase